MKKRQHSPTSKMAHDSIKPFKEAIWLQIEQGLEKLAVGGTFHEISRETGLKEDQVWKRLSEMEEQHRVYKTGLTRTNPSGRKSTVWQLISKTPKTEKERTIQKQLSLL